METFLIEYNQKIIGTYNKYKHAETFILSCLQNKFMKGTAKILKFKENSCYCESEYNITLPSIVSNNMVNQISSSDSSLDLSTDSDSSSESESDSDSDNLISNKVTVLPHTLEIQNVTKPSVPSVDYNDPEFLKLAKQKVDLQHNINLLKVHKERIEESKRIYENDLKLFNLFNENLKTDTKFVISDLFLEKYKLFTKLKETNKLSWEEFTKEYKQENYYGDYFGTNQYEDMFIYDNDTTNPKNISEELDIETDSDTDTSVSNK